jgi:agmatinase
VELYDSELNTDISKIGIHTFDELEPEMKGPAEMSKRIYMTAQWVLSQNKFLVTLGGEHSISIGIVKAISEKYKNLTVLQLDAHADLRDTYWGTEYSHACAMRRILEYASTVQVGIRSLSEDDARLIKKKGLKVFLAPDIAGKDNWINTMISCLTDNVYITIDLDVFDPSIMPAVGTPEPGGLGWYEILKIIKSVAEKKRIVGFDVVELSPMPGNIAPDFLAARLIFKLIGYALLLKYPKTKSQ